MTPTRTSALIAASLLTACGQPVPDGMTLELLPTEPTASDALTAVVPRRPDGEGVTYVYTWSVDGSAVNDLDGPFVPADRTSRGQVWSVTATPTSADGKKVGSTATGEVTIGNTPPVSLSVSIDPQTPTSSEDLIATAAGDDPDGDDLTWTYTWYVRGTEVQSGSSNRLEVGNYVHRDLVDVEAVATDGQGESPPVRSSPVTILNSRPVLDDAAITFDDPSPNGFTRLTCAPGDVFDQDGEPITYQFDWTLNGVRLRFDSPEADRIGRRGDVLTCMARPHDGTAFGDWVESPAITLTNTPPAAPEVKITPDDANNFGPITCTVLSATTDWDGDALSYTFAFFRNGSAWTGPVETGSRPGDTVGMDHTEIGDTWTCTAIANDGIDAGPVGASAEVTIVDGWPDAITFTNCGKTGRSGPTQAECNSRYAETPLSGKVEVDGGVQYWQVPATGRYFIEARGARGGIDTNRGWGTPGTGAIIEGVFHLERGTVLEIAVGQMGSNETWSGGGGGGSWVMADGDPIIIAGGGGAVGYYGSGNYVRACDGSLTQYATLGFVSTSSAWQGCQGVRWDRLGEGGLTGSGTSTACQRGAGGAGINSNGAQDTCADPTNSGGKGPNDGFTGGTGTAQGGFGGGGAAAWSAGGGGGYSGGDGSWSASGGGGSFNLGSATRARTGSSSHGQVYIDLLLD